MELDFRKKSGGNKTVVLNLWVATKVGSLVFCKHVQRVKLVESNDN